MTLWFRFHYSNLSYEAIESTGSSGSLIPSQVLLPEWNDRPELPEILTWMQVFAWRLDFWKEDKKRNYNKE